jgi:mannose-1-phosphate guanylyltransferase
MQAVILAGGLGTRLRPLTYTTPKPLLPILNVPMVERLITTLPSEVDKVVLAVSYMVDRLQEHFENNELDIEVVLVEEKEPLGTGGAIKNVEKYIDSTFLALNGDVVCSLDFNEILDFHRKSQGLGTISMWEVEDPTRFGIIGTDSDSCVTRFLEKPKKEEAFSNWINAGVYVLEPEVLDLMEPDKVISIEREIFPLLAEKRRLYGFKFYGFWVDAGTPEAYLETHRTLLDNMQITLALPENVQINQPVLIGRNCEFADDTKIGPYVTMGDDVSVQTGTVLTNSVVLGNTKIGKNNHLSNVIVGYGCSIEDNIRLGKQVVIGDNQVLKQGTEIPTGSKIGDA